MRLSIIIYISLIVSVILFGCSGINDQDVYIKSLNVGDTLDVKIENLMVYEAKEGYTKYYYRFYNSQTMFCRDYYITVNPDNVIVSIWSKKL